MLDNDADEVATVEECFPGLQFVLKSNFDLRCGHFYLLRGNFMGAAILDFYDVARLLL